MFVSLPISAATPNICTTSLEPATSVRIRFSFVHPEYFSGTKDNKLVSFLFLCQKLSRKPRTLWLIKFVLAAFLSEVFLKKLQTNDKENAGFVFFNWRQMFEMARFKIDGTAQIVRLSFQRIDEADATTPGYKKTKGDSPRNGPDPAPITPPPQN